MKTKSDRIRQMYDEGKTVAEIARELNTHYSFVHTVVAKYRENGAPTKHSERPSKSKSIRSLYDQGRTLKEIKELLNLDYAFVYGVLKRHKDSKSLNDQTDKGGQTDED